MEIVVGKPPNYEQIVAAIPAVLDVRRAIFTYGGAIYNPSGAEIDAPLMVHEKVHSERQNGNPDGWWQRYLVDKTFRLAEELPAHAAEYAELCRQQPDRNRQNLALHRIAVRLAGPMYGGLITFGDASNEILLLKPR